MNIYDEKKIKRYICNNSWKQCELLPYYRERYVCFCQVGDLSFEELIKIFFRGNANDQIGAMSIIAEKYPDKLYQLICKGHDTFSHKALRFILDFVLPDYLPLFLPKDRLMNYEFGREFSNDIWVRILMEVRSLL